MNVNEQELYLKYSYIESRKITLLFLVWRLNGIFSFEKSKKLNN
jgi:hypothetical protein